MEIGLERCGHRGRRDGFRARDGARDEKLADQAAVDADAQGLHDLHIRCTIVIVRRAGRAPMLFIGRKVGGAGPRSEVDIALDPLGARPSPLPGVRTRSASSPWRKGKSPQRARHVLDKSRWPLGQGRHRLTKGRPEPAPPIADRKGVYVTT